MIKKFSKQEIEELTDSLPRLTALSRDRVGVKGANPWVLFSDEPFLSHEGEDIPLPSPPTFA